MPTMPNVVGQQFQVAQQSLTTAGVLNTNALGYFGTYPVTAVWKLSTQPADTVLAQNPASGGTVAVNSPVTLTVAQPSVGVVFP